MRGDSAGNSSRRSRCDRRPTTESSTPPSTCRVQSHLKKWTPTEATIVALRRRTVMGMATLNWDIELQLPDGGRTLSKGDEVPSYAQWYAAPGAVVPAVVNPKDAGAATIDWPAFALAQFDQAGFDDDPPEGSIAAEVESSRGAGATQTTQAGGRRDSDVSSDGPVTLDATMQGWIDACGRLHEAQGLRQGARRLAGGRDVHACPGRRHANRSGMSDRRSVAGAGCRPRRLSRTRR